MYSAKHQLPLPKASLVAQMVKKVKVKVTQLSVQLFEDCSPWNSLGQNTGMGNLSLLQRIFPTQGSNSDLPHCRRILYQLSHKGRPRILEWVAYPFSSGSSQPRNGTSVSCIAGGFSQLVKNEPAMQETWVPSLGWEDPLEKGMATHFNLLAWRILMDRGVWLATVRRVTKSQT